IYSDSQRREIFTNGLPNLNVVSLIEDNDGSVWATFTLGIVCHIQKNGEVTHFMERDGMPDGPACSLAKNTKGQIWFSKSGQTGQKNAQVGIYRGGHFETLLNFGRPIVRIAAASDGGIWICNGSQLLKYHEGEKPVEMGNYFPDRTIIPTALLEDDSGAVWIGTGDSGVFRFDDGNFQHIETSHPQISTLLQDREGNIWAGTVGGGLNRIRQRGVELQGQEQGLPFQTVRSLCEDTNGVLWAATQNGLLANYKDGNWNTISTNENWRGIATSVAADRQGAVWIGTQQRTLYRLRDGQFTAWTIANGLVARTIRSVLAASNGDVWIGGDGSNTLQCLRNGELKNFPAPANVRAIRAMAEDPAGNIWIGTSGGILL
ncbi:MAG TPA: two-component regulator propeller domain-containing protein, partial [Candidatus Baltobacteraceae bacterium]|nr:two-component regulator propeller domain-containing protein [Candidatus Baltobacteraceae bacterium]